MSTLLDLWITKYGFRWRDVLVERTASSDLGKNPKFQVIRVFCPNGELIEVLIRPRKNKVTVIPKASKIAP